MMKDESRSRRRTSSLITHRSSFINSFDKYRVPILALAMAIIAAAVYIPSINAPFVYDDRHAIFQNPAVVGGESIKNIFTDPSAFSGSPNARMYRPLTLLSYYLTYRVAGFHMIAWHGFHIFFHAINAVLLLLIALKIFDDKRVAFLAALLWSVHPIASEAVIYQSARSNLLSASAVLCGFYLYVSGENSAIRRGISVFVFSLGLLCKETAIVLPALMFWHDLNRRGAACRAPAKAKYLINYIPFAVILVVYIVLRMTLLRLETFHVAAPVRPVGENLLMQSGVIVFYLKETLWPIGLSIEHDLAAVASLAPANASLWRWPAFAIPLLIAAALSAVLLRRKAFALSLGIVWWFVALAPESSIIPLVQVANERRAYLPLAGLAIAAGAGINYLLNRSRVGAIHELPLRLMPLCIMMICLFTLTFNRESEWKTRSSLWIAAIEAYPGSVVAMHGLATTKLDDEGDLRIAEWLYRKIIREDPSYYGARLGLGRLLLKKGDFQGAEEQLRIAISLGPKEDAPWVALADLYFKMGLFDKAEQAARIAVELNPRSAQGWNNLGIALARQDKPQEALEAIDRAISLNPDYAIGHFNRGNILRQMGRMDEARSEYQKALDLDPTFNPAKAALESMNR